MILLVTSLLFLVLSNQSGVFGESIAERIFNGSLAVRGQFPFQTRSLKLATTGKYSTCGGSLISNKWVLTAAHCVSNTVNLTLMLGQINIKNYSGVIYYSLQKKNIYPHPEYDPATIYNDIALLEIPTKVDLTNYPYIQTVRMPKRSENPVTYFNDKNGTASGWGGVNDTTGSEDLRWGNIHIMNHADCVEQLGKIKSLSPITEKQICTDKTVFYHGGCPGDSGGPVAVKGADGKPIVVGVTSWLVGLCSYKYPVVNAYVGAYLDWINSVTGIPIQD